MTVAKSACHRESNGDETLHRPRSSSVQSIPNMATTTLFLAYSTTTVFCIVKSFILKKQKVGFSQVDPKCVNRPILPLM